MLLLLLLLLLLLSCVTQALLSCLQLSEMCVFLCTEAADQVTGSNFVMDGGWNSK